jgi:hypothetical protein
MTAPYATPSAAAWALLDACRSGQIAITRKAAGFLGETAIDPTPLSEKQRNSLATLLTKAELPPLAGGDA